MNEHQFQITFVENKCESSICITEYKDGKTILHSVEEPAIHTDKETIDKLYAYLGLYISLTDDEKKEGVERLLERIRDHEWLVAAKAQIATMEAEAGIVHNDDKENK